MSSTSTSSSKLPTRDFSNLALTQSTATQSFQNEPTEVDGSEDEEEWIERDSEAIYAARRHQQPPTGSSHTNNATVEEMSDDDDANENGVSYANAAFIDSHAANHPISTGGGSSFDWCLSYLERDDLVNLENETQEDEELIDLRREYGQPLSAAYETPLPTLTATLEKAEKEETETDDTNTANQKKDKEVSLLHMDDPTTSPEDDWDLLGLQCDCPCDSCRRTFVGRTFDDLLQYEQEMAKKDEEEIQGEEKHLDHKCECLIFDQPESLHLVLLDLFEDFYRFRIHLHRVTFATALDQARRQALNKGLPPEAVETAYRTAYSRSLILLKARARRDLKHIELLEACANQLGWNQHDAPNFSQTNIFCEVAPPGPSLLCGLIIEFLSYFLIQKTTCSNFDKTKITSLCNNLVLFGIKTGDLEPTHRVTLDCLHQCDRSMLDLPLADLIETELYKHVQEEKDRQLERLSSLTTKDSTLTLPQRRTEREIEDAEIFPSSGSASSSSTLSLTPTIHQVFQGYWILESFTPAGGTTSTAARLPASSTPALLHLTPALNTKSKMAAYKELERVDMKMEKAGTEAHMKSTSASSTTATSTTTTVSSSTTSSSVTLSPSLTCSQTISVIVPSTVIDLLSESSDGGVGWQFNLELTRFLKDSRTLTREQLNQLDATSSTTKPNPFTITDDRLEPYYHITKAGHVNCA